MSADTAAPRSKGREVSARLWTSDIWHNAFVGDQGVVTLTCTGHTVERGRAMLDSLKTNVTCLRCQRKIAQRPVEDVPKRRKCRRCKGTGSIDGKRWGQEVCLRCDGTGREPTVQLNDGSPCEVDPVSSRMCERGTKGCTVRHIDGGEA